ncbi:oxygenase MpaB family protein [Telmatobacter sp. DSM 110680]|uniref:Oxygenase MpaB family protein n=1 Tax=Telmatobacter sp. DSM 110680 TaxID=3036704 RepID=A0AAU7DE50_9BACT
MASPVPADSSTSVSSQVLERHIASVEQQVARPVEGIFGADSITWRINRESALFLGAGRAALLQLAHPWVATALDQHSSLLSKPIARFHSTFRVVFTMIFGTAPQAFRASRSLYQTHTRITGKLPSDVAGYAAGSRYEALNLPALMWVYATLIESAVIAYECVLPRLTSNEREAYYAESKILAGLFGIAPEALPPDWGSFQAYVRQMLVSQELGVSDRSRIMAHRILTGAGSWVPIPRWYQSLTTEILPPRFRTEFGLSFGEARMTSADRARRWLPRVYSSLPSSLRYVGPFQEAQARLENRSTGFIARRSNQFWIGQPLLPFNE